ncbi:MAG: PD-(D/E)XK nuclease family transposase, partial [Lachnospiraceae bacterium]|nr:PD-(D/E)XK nuclease family transposase [Lachnospiraceae bacterium]
MKDPKTWEKFSQLSLEQKQPLLDFFMGRTSLLITYDTFFKRIMSPERHPERLESFLGAMLEEEIRIKDVLPREGTPFTEDGSLVILDLLVEIGGKRIVNLEMQKVGLYFPGERSEVYSSDLIMRQYNRVRAERGKHFKYSDIKKTYMFIILVNSSSEFKSVPGKYI